MAVTITVKYYRSEIVAHLQSYDLRIVVESATDMPEKIFVFQRGVPPYDDPETPEDRFICLADPVDLEEYPEDAPALGAEMPYFRLSEVILRFRNMDILEQTRDLIAQDIQALVNSLKAAANVVLTEEVTYE